MITDHCHVWKDTNSRGQLSTGMTMSIINLQTKEINIKIVYYGTGLEVKQQISNTSTASSLQSHEVT